MMRGIVIRYNKFIIFLYGSGEFDIMLFKFLQKFRIIKKENKVSRVLTTSLDANDVFFKFQKILWHT